ncbi:hypothetical protein ACRAWD_32140 [Caulobacter segnis]
MLDDALRRRWSAPPYCTAGRRPPGASKDRAEDAGRSDGIDTRHGHRISAGYLARAFGPEVTRGDRSVCTWRPSAIGWAVDPGLSRTTPQSHPPCKAFAALQGGGPMNPAEIGAFLADPWAQSTLRLRQYDEAGKAPGRRGGQVQ